MALRAAEGKAVMDSPKPNEWRQDGPELNENEVHICAAITRLQFAALKSAAEEQPKSDLGQACAALIEQVIDFDDDDSDDDE
jgi:hypothetical protein